QRSADTSVPSPVAARRSRASRSAGRNTMSAFVAPPFGGRPGPRFIGNNVYMKYLRLSSGAVPAIGASSDVGVEPAGAESALPIDADGEGKLAGVAVEPHRAHAEPLGGLLDREELVAGGPCIGPQRARREVRLDGGQLDEQAGDLGERDRGDPSLVLEHYG